MTTINTIDDLLWVVRRNEEFRAALRRELLTDDLLALPGRFEEMLKSQNEMRETQNGMLETQNKMLQAQSKMLRTQNKMLDDQREMRGDIRALHGMYRRQHDDMARFRGNYAADAARQNAGDMAMLFARSLGLERRVEVRPMVGNELGQMLRRNYAALDALNLRDRAWITFQFPDIIVEATELRNGAAPHFCLAIEASYTGGSEDLLRATDHAKILRAATGLEAYAVVASVRVGPSIENIVFHDIDDFIRANDQDTALLYQLEERELEPLDPC